MNFEEMIKKALEELKNNDELFSDMVEELDGWNGYADGFRCYPMCELDELFHDCPVSKFLGMITKDFNLNDDYMIDTIYGLESTNDKTAVYRDNVDEGELLDNIIENASHLYFNDSDFEELIENIVTANEGQAA